MASKFSKPGLAAGLALLCLTAAFSAGAEDAGEFYVNTYRSIGSVSPRSMRSSTMGRAGRGLADGVNSMGVNPAGLGAFTGSGFDVSLGYDWLDDGYDDTDQVTFKLGGAVSLERWKPSGGPNQAIGALLHTQNYSGAANMGMKREQTGVMMAYGLHLMDDILAGVSVSLFDGEWRSDRIGNDPLYLDRSFLGGDFKLGGIYRFSEETTLGGTLGYATGSFKEKAAYAAGAGSGSLDRYSIGVGVAHQYCDATMILGDIWYDRMKTDVPGVLKENNKSWGLSVGVEQQVIGDVMALRGGLYYDRTSYSGGNETVSFTGGSGFSKGRFGITAGVGIKLYQFDIGYSLDVNSGGDVKNLLDLSAEW